MNISFKPIEESDDIAVYQEMTFPRYRQWMEAFKTDNDLIVIKATDEDNTPSGLGLAFNASGTGNGEIYSIFVDPELRQQGVGTALFQHLEKILHDRQCRLVEAYYDAGKPATPVVERILSKQNWEKPKIHKMFYKAYIRELMKAPWNKYRLPQEYTIFPWIELTEQEREIILKKQEAEQWYPPILSPFSATSMEPDISIGVRYKGEVVGWMICSRVSEDTVRYSVLFVRKDLQRLGRAVPLISESLRRHDASSDKNIPQYALWQVEYDNIFMIKFVERRMMPYVCRVNELRGSFKQISDI